MVICRSILDIFGDVQNFQISRFQKIWKFFGNCCISQIVRYWVFVPLSFGRWIWFFTWNFWIFIFLEFPDSRFSGIWNLEIQRKWKSKNFEWKIKFRDQNWVEKIPNILQFVKCSNSQKISRFFGIWNLEIWKFWRSPKMSKINLQMTIVFLYLIINTKCSFWNIFTFLGKIGGRFQLWKTTNPIWALFFA